MKDNIKISVNKLDRTTHLKYTSPWENDISLPFWIVGYSKEKENTEVLKKNKS